MSNEQSIIETALVRVRQELQAKPDAFSSVAPLDQLLRVADELSEMLDDLRDGRAAHDRSGLGRMVVDSWPLQHELTERVCAAVQAYSAATGKHSS